MHSTYWLYWMSFPAPVKILFLPWQGGTVLSADDLRAVSQAQQSLSLRGMSAADAAKKAAAAKAADENK